jgi:hypothetical protein
LGYIPALTWRSERKLRENLSETETGTWNLPDGSMSADIYTAVISVADALKREPNSKE